MAAFTSAGRGRVFISYRREDSAFPAGWLYDRLCARFGSDYVFKDVDSIDPGDDFLRVIEDAVGSCQVLLALIGDHWLDITDPTGHRRLDDPNDFVRLEIEAALRRDVRVIPLLVGRAPLPSSEQLPDSLRGLIRRHAIELSPNRFEPDVARLVRTIDKTLAAIVEGPADAPAPVDRTSGWPGPAATDLPEAPAEGRGNLLADPHWADALSAFFAKRWTEAVQRFEALQARYPGEGRVETRLEEARRLRDIDGWSSKAESAAADGDWDVVVTALENLTGLDPNYPDIAARLEQARIAQRRKELVDEMTALHQAGRWDAVVAAAQELGRLDPDHPDPGGIVSDAQAKIRDADLADRYAQALNHLDQEQWQQAAELFTGIEQEQPGYRDAAALLKTAQRQRDLAAWSDQADAATGHDDWDTAVTALENMCAIDATYRDASARLEQARSAKRLRTLVDKVTALHQAGRWKDVLSAAEELAQLDPENSDPGGMVSDAQAKIRDARQHMADLQDKWARNTGAAAKSVRHQAPTVPEDSPEAAAATPPSSETGSLAGRSNAQESKLPPSMEDLTVVELPTDTTPTPPEVPFFKRLNRRTTIVFAVIAAFAVVAVALVIINQKLLREEHPTGTAQSASDPNQQLLAMVRGDDHCASAPGEIHPAEAVATVVCSPDAAVVSGLVYSLFPDQATLDSYFNSGVIRSQFCPGMSQSPQNWHRAAIPQQKAGRVECWVDDGVPHMRWTIDSQLLLGSADGSRGETIDQVYQWWANRYLV